MRGLIVVLALLLTASCRLANNPVPLRRICADGWPLLILQDRECPKGICGYTCAPDRWRTLER